MRPYGPDIVGADSISARTFYSGLYPSHIALNNSSMRSFLPLQVQPASRHSKPVEARYSCTVACLATVALLAFFAAAQHGGLGVGQHRPR